MVKAGWQYHWRRLFIDDLVYALGFVLLGIIVDLFHDGQVASFFTARQVIATVLMVNWIEVVVLTRDNTNFFIQNGVSRKYSWVIQWFSLVGTTVIVIVLNTIYLLLTHGSSAWFNSFNNLFSSYQSATNQGTLLWWSFLFLVSVLLTLIGLLFAFILGLLMNRMSGIAAFFIVYGSGVLLFSVIAGSIGLIYHFGSTALQHEILKVSGMMVGLFPNGNQMWPLLVLLVVIVAILSGISYLLIRRLQVRIRKS